MAKPYVAVPEDGVAWVTGASSGIGAAVAARLAGKGFTVVATARRQDELDDLAAKTGGPGRIVPIAGDVTDADAMQGIIGQIESEIGKLALCVLNAGVYIPVSGDDLDRDAFAKTFDVNLKGTVNALVPAADAMKAHGKGQIAIVASVAGYSGLPTSAAYGASKAGLLNLAEALKFDFDHLGLTIQVISPGFVDTPATADNPFPMPFLMEVDDAADRLISGLATGRFEVTFPRRFTYQLKLLRALPYWLYFPLLARATGWNKRKASA